jgi:lipoprotein-releasing system permease protein
VNISGFIASRMLRHDDRQRMSRPVVRIATTGIAVGMALMIVAIAVVRGFQEEVRNKVIGFGSHFQVVGNDDGRSRESTRLLFEQDVYDSLKAIEGVDHVQLFAVKPGIIETGDALQGIIVKGAAHDFDWRYLSSVLEEGDVLRTDSSGFHPTDILISRTIADRMKIGIGDRVSLYFVQSNSEARQQNFTIRGIYRTDLEDFDRQYVLTDIYFLQKYSGWGIDAQILADSVCRDGMMAIGALGFGGQGDLYYRWPEQDWEDEGPWYISPDRDTSYTVVVSDEAGSTADSATLVLDFLDDYSREVCRPFVSMIKEGKPSEQSYVGGYEVSITEYTQLSRTDEELQRVLPFYLTTVRITDRNPDIFSWLAMLDINVVIIILMMISISIINMTSALLIIILERQSMIGALKAFGIRDGPVIRIFLLNAAWIIGKGLLWGNAIGLCLILLQHYTGIIALDPRNYYVDHVPVLINAGTILLLNCITMLVCVIALVLPALYVTSITPIRSIRFN